MTEKTAAVFRYIAYTVEIILVYVLNSSPRLLPEILGAKPCLLLCVAVTIAMFERELPSMAFGIACGILIDLGYSNAVGVFTIALALLCFIIGYAANNLIRANFVNFIICSFVVTGSVFMLYFIIEFLWKGYPFPWVYFEEHMISRMAQTFLLSVIFYFVNRLIYRILSEDA